ncbi:hypothetical protein ASPZODRAFT_1897791 [Penicilliopsis zonata CBS 506.65]|uniref:Uncharacterized protein n=1 Tax=Penicilliopsis zonata CBS 506.65 TaxID=1073090 RepID=A0A1L9SIR3_9EURO|nr:hypothetical protein ASPZODRAFT_1897791 [Penicilliopsis zonata CBS 506.65]OJJ47105.1 hypothetical protein ASPZODRAFT_1897791 [Penicilliopsis zonata CBS 506.65]
MADSTWEERSFVYFIQQYTTAGDWDQSVSHLSFLPNLYAKCQEKASSDAASACFRLAVDAAAQVALGHEARAPSLISKARRNYGKALGALQQLLNTHSQAVKDETLAAVVVISLFEDISGDRNGLSGSHTTGFELLIKLRGRGQLDYPQGRDLFNYAYANTHIEILALGDKPRLDMEWIIAALDVSDPIPRLITTSSKISQFFVKVSSAQAAMQAQLFVSPALVIGQLATWLEYARGLDRDLVRWCDGLPEEWIPSVIPSPTGEQLLITYPRISVATIWNYYRAVRIVMQQILTGLQGALAPLASLSNISPNLSSSALSSTQVVVHDMIDEICRSIPFALGDIDPRGRFTADPARPWASQPSSRHKFKAVHGYSLLWPLWYVLSCGLATPDQSKQVRTALARLGSEVGIKLALTLAEGAPGSPPSQWGDHP